MAKSFHIILTVETGWHLPVQATSYFVDQYDVLHIHRLFSAWASFDEALFFLSHHHSCPIFVDFQIKIGLYNKKPFNYDYP